MQILQNIITELTKENEILTRLILIPESFWETFIGMLLFTTLLNIKTTKKSKLKYVLIVSILANMCNIFIINPYRSYINLLIIVLSICFCFKAGILKTIFATIIPIFFSILCESIIIKLSFIFLNFDITKVTSYPLYRFIIAFSVQILSLLFYLLIRYLKFQINIVENMDKKNKFIFYINIIFAVLVMSMQFIITGFYLNKLPTYIVILSNLTLISYFLLSIYSLSKTTQCEVISINLEQEKENNKILRALQDDLRGFRHDFSNIICTMGGYIHIKDMDGLSKYFSQIQKDVKKMNNLGSLNSTVINNPAIFALVSSKYSKAVDLGIEMNINVFINLNKLNMKIYEFTRVLGILLDNAIEAAKECEDKKINMEILRDLNHNRQLLIIENTYTNKDVNVDQIYDKNFSTKPGNSGLGLWEVRQILKRNTNLNLYTTKSPKLFKQQLEMYFEENT